MSLHTLYRKLFVILPYDNIYIILFPLLRPNIVEIKDQGSYSPSIKFEYNVHMFKNLTIKNFRGLKNLVLEDFKQINIIVGDNSIGKSTILDALYIGINPNNPNLPTKTNIFRNIDEIQTKKAGEEYWKTFFYDFDFQNTIELTFNKDTSGNRTIQISPFNSTSVDSQLQKSEVHEPSTFYDSSDTSFRNIIGLQIDSALHDKLSQSRLFLDHKGLQSVIDKDYTELLNGVYLNNLTNSKPTIISSQFDDLVRLNNKTKLISFLTKLEPTIRDINHLSNTLVATDTRFSEAINIGTYGNGFVKFLSILTFILSLEKANICLIDEIENGLYHTKQQTLWKSILSLANVNQDLQLFITTHSLEMIHNLYQTSQDMSYCDKINLYRIEKNVNNETQAFRYTYEQYLYAMKEKMDVR